jgi:DNA-binding SARP family transcriptional activator
VLLLHANQPVAADRLLDEIWGEEPPATATHTVQVYISNLRKVLGAERLVTRPPGYLVYVEPGELDLERFDQLLTAGQAAAARGAHEQAAAELREALSLWRGPPLADFVYERFAQSAARRLEEMRATAVEERIEADLAVGRHSELVGELQELVAQHPLRERLRGQLMLALYRCGRQAEALELFRTTRRLLVEELGIEPSPSLQALERAILAHGPELEVGALAREQEPEPPNRAILVVSPEIGRLTDLLAVIEPLARSAPAHELILTLALPPEGDLSAATSALNERRAALAERGIAARAAAFISRQTATDLVRLASEQDVDLLLVDGSGLLDDGELTGTAVALLETAPCDAGIVFGLAQKQPAEGVVLVPFGGADDDWAALELGAWYAQAVQTSARLIGVRDSDGERDASRLLAHAALAVQQLVGVSTEPALTVAGERGILDEAETARVVIAGLGRGWRAGDLGWTRRTLVGRSASPVVLVHRGLRPGGLAPRQTLTRFTWSLSERYDNPARQSESA